MQYNTSREQLAIKEYGRGVHEMVKYLLTIKDREQRQKNAEAVIEIMAVLNSQLKNVEDFQHKLWDHLFLISDYKLDVDSPYPLPTKELKQQKPTPLPYPKNKIKWNHLGKSFETLFEKAIVETDENKKKGLISILAWFMKVAYTNWHQETVHDDMIREELLTMSKGKLVFDPSIRFHENVDTNTSITIHSSVKNNSALSKKSNRNNQRFGSKNNNNSNQGNMNGSRNNKFNRFKKKAS